MAWIGGSIPIGGGKRLHGGLSGRQATTALLLLTVAVGSIAALNHYNAGRPARLRRKRERLTADREKRIADRANDEKLLASYTSTDGWTAILRWCKQADIRSTTRTIAGLDAQIDKIVQAEAEVTAA